MATENPYTLRFKVLEMARSHLTEEYYSKRDTPFTPLLVESLTSLRDYLKGDLAEIKKSRPKDEEPSYIEQQINNGLITLNELLPMVKSFQVCTSPFPSVEAVQKVAQTFYKFVEQK